MINRFKLPSRFFLLYFGFLLAGVLCLLFLFRPLAGHALRENALVDMQELADRTSGFPSLERYLTQVADEDISSATAISFLLHRRERALTLLTAVATSSHAQLWVVDQTGKVLLRTPSLDLSGEEGDPIPGIVPEEAQFGGGSDNTDQSAMSQTETETNYLEALEQAAYENETDADLIALQSDFIDFLDDYTEPVVHEPDSLFPVPMITAASRIGNTDYHLFLSCPLSSLEPLSRKMLYFAALVVSILSLVSLAFPVGFYFLFYRPLHSCAEYAEDCTGGTQQDPPLKENMGDEFQTIQKNLAVMSDEIHKNMEEQQILLSNISHDFRSPLTSIRGYTAAILDGTIPPDQQDTYLERSIVLCDQLTRLTSDIILINRMSGDRNSFHPLAFDLNSLLYSFASSYELACRGKNIRLILKLEPKPTQVFADREKIQQVVMNLLDNAVKFSHPNSDIIISSRLDGEKMHVSVKDFGICIPQEEIPRIWSRFYTADTKRGANAHSCGSGIGLTIVKQILSLHNEDIFVTSSPESGTEFTFSLPIYPPSDREEPKTKASAFDDSIL